MQRTVKNLSASLLIAEARKQNLRVKVIDPDFSLYSISKNKKKINWSGMAPDFGNMLAAKCCRLKGFGKKLLDKAGLRVSAGIVVSNSESSQKVLAAARRLGYPVVLKPEDGRGGRGVFVNLKTPREVAEVLPETRKFGNVLIEKFISGKDLRLLAIGGKFVAAAERRAPKLTGDGQSTVRQLINSENKKHEGPGYEPIQFNAVTRETLRRQHLTYQSKPRRGKSFKIKDATNVFGGGYSVDATDIIHPEYKKILRKAWLAVYKPPFLGLDIMARDYTKNPKTAGYAIIEANTNPAMEVHVFPRQGRPRNVAKAILNYIF